MRIIFMGTPDFAVGCLERIIADGHEVALVMSQPDRPKGRKYVMTPPPVKVCAEKHGIEVYQPETLKNNREAIDKLKKIKADIAVVVAYGRILRKEILQIPMLGCINVHASILPKYRGAGPIQWAILNGETETGVTIMQLDEGMDTGDIISRSYVDISIDTSADQLYTLLAKEGAKLLGKTLVDIASANAVCEEQNHSEATHAPPLSRSMSPIDWEENALTVHNKVRGLHPWPSATAFINDKKVKIHKTEYLDEAVSGKKAGEVVSVSPFTVVCGDGKQVIIKELQAEGGKRLDSKSFLLGNPVETGSVLS